MPFLLWNNHLSFSITWIAVADFDPIDYAGHKSDNQNVTNTDFCYRLCLFMPTLYERNVPRSLA